MSNNSPSAHGISRVMASSGVVPQAVPSLPQLDPCLVCARLPSNLQDRITPNNLCPLVPTSDRFTSWLTLHGIAQMNNCASIVPPEIIICRHLVMARTVLPATLKNYAAGLSRFIKFCDDFGISESHWMPASEPLLCEIDSWCWECQ